MKKLLAIAVAVAFAAPAMADTSVYGKAHVSVNKASGSSLDMQSHLSRIGLKGSNALDNGLTATHKFELGINLTDAPAAGGTLTSRDTWVGLKGGFGEVRFGRHTIPSDLMDDHADFLTNGEIINPVPGRQNNVMAYIGSFGPVTVAVAHIANGSDLSPAAYAAAVADVPPSPTAAASAAAVEAEDINKANDIAIAYKAGPFQASLGHIAPSTGPKLTGVGLSYSGANYGVGFKHDRVSNGGAKQNTLTGKYSFGKAYVAAGYGKVKNSTRKSTVLEVGYGLGKSTKTYFEYAKENPGGGGAAVKNARVGLVHSF